MKKILRVAPEDVFESFCEYPMQKVVFEGEESQVISGKIKKHLY